ncbi:UNVERIFIED_CONTAM: hypothetical protein Sradi_5091700 [Sesamum radiatum]|uniref:CCHC-type domain-containing protein n=1 Tax=Sesamum radiatum TaxID=300843 RepID=A0AAW2M332_SESRA
MIEGSSVREHGVMMLSLVEKLKDLQANFEKEETYVDMILQSLPPSYDQFIINYNMNGLEKSLHELINMLVQYKATIEKSEPSILVGEVSTTKAKGKVAEREKRKKDEMSSTAASTLSVPVTPLGGGKGKGKRVRQSKIPNDVCIYCREKGHWKRECPELLSDEEASDVGVLRGRTPERRSTELPIGGEKRKDLKIIYNRLELEVDERRPNLMPKIVYTLTKEQKRGMCEWIAHLKFPDGYASNLPCYVDKKELRMHGMKSHDCHVFMRKLIPTAFCEILPKPVWSVLIQILCKRNMPCRNDNLYINDTPIQLFIFNSHGRASGTSKKRWLNGSERHIIEMYILTNCEVVTPYYEFLFNELYGHHHSEDPIIEELVATQVKDWFKRRYSRRDNSIRLPTYSKHADHSVEMLLGRSRERYEENLTNVVTTDEENDFYGIMKEIIQLTYPLIPNLYMVLFKCRWINPARGMKVHPSYHLVDVNFKKLYQKDDPFILAQQTIQVYFTEYSSMKRDKANRMAICKIKARRVVDDSKWTKTVAYQSEQVVPVPIVPIDN